MANKKNNLKYYNGNPFIRRGHYEHKYTPEEVKEYKKCKNDIIYFIENYCKIVTIDEGKILFKPYDYQRKMIKTFNDNRMVISLLPRQSGKTTTVGAFILHYLLFHNDKNVGILANKHSLAREILNRIKIMLEGLPIFLQSGVLEYNKNSVEFDTGSKVYAYSAASDAVRGMTFNLVYLDEFAFVDNADEFYTSTYPVITSGDSSKVIITSTPNGYNLFHELWEKALQGESQYVPIKVKWNDIPRRDEEWKKKQISTIGLIRWLQEFECKFISSFKNTLIDLNVLNDLKSSEPIEETTNFKVFEKPKKDHIYAVTVDVSEGLGLDNSVINITDITYKSSFKQVAIFTSSKISHNILPQYVFKYATEYNNALVLIETNSIGSGVGSSLYYDYEYENMVITSVKSTETRVGGVKNITYGVKTTKKTKLVGCLSLKDMVENSILKIEDESTINELRTFISNKTSYAASTGTKDDRVMTLVLLGWLVNQDYFAEMTNGIKLNEILTENKRDKIIDDLGDAGFLLDNTKDKNAPDYSGMVLLGVNNVPEDIDARYNEQEAIKSTLIV